MQAWKQREMTDGFLRFPPVRARFREFRNQDQNSTGSARPSMVNFLSLARITPCMNSCGLTCQHTEHLTRSATHKPQGGRSA